MTPMKGHKIFSSVALIVLMALAAGIYYTVDPGNTRWIPRCVFRTVTGWDCPGCGSQRMLHALLNGDFTGAWNYNPLLFCFIPLLLLYAILDLFPGRFPKMFRLMHSPVTIAIIGVIIIAWGILRNLI